MPNGVHRKLYDLAGPEDDRRTSPYCWRIRFALAHKGLEYQCVPWRRVEKDLIAFSGQDLVSSRPIALQQGSGFDNDSVLCDVFAKRWTGHIHESSAFTKENLPVLQVPVLVDGETVVHDS